MIDGWQEFHFLRPLWLLGALPALLLPLLWARRHGRNSPWRRALAPELLAVLLAPADSLHRRWAPWALAAALLAGAASLAGPTWQRLPQPVEQKQDALVILFDLSLSMFAEDLSPSRLTRAAHKITDVLRRREEGFTGLVAYAGDSHVVAPLTDDVRTIENLLLALSPAMMPVLGSNPGSALELAHELLDNAGLERGRLLLVTDGVDAVSELASRCRPRFPLSVLGVGTAAPATIPLDRMEQPGRHLADRQGKLVRAPLDADRLAAVAELCRGRYRSIEVGDSDIAHLLAAPWLKAAESVEAERFFDAWADFGYWGALALLPLLLFGFRKGLLACAPLCMGVGLAAGLLPAPAAAGFWEDLWLRPDQQGYEALQEGRPQTAADLFANPAWRNAAKYRNKDYQGAADGWANAEATPRELYNLGNALAQLGDYRAAIAAYDKALAAAPNHEDAAFNKALMERLLAEQQAAEQQKQAQSGDPSFGDSQDSEDAQGAQQNQGQEQSQGVRQGANEPERAEADSATEPADQAASEDGAEAEAPPTAGEEGLRDEQAQALEQWLRRVPDDPGGLLRRKFQYETNQRLRRGDYRDRQQEKTW